MIVCKNCGKEIVDEKRLKRKSDACSIECAKILKRIKISEAKRIRVRLIPYKEMTLEWWIFKYGEQEGTQKYLDRNLKTRHNLENSIKRFGIEAGPKKFKEFCDNLVNSQTEEELIRKYGEVEGKRKREDIIQKKAMTLERFTDRYGCDEGHRRFEQYKLLRSRPAIQKFIDKYGKVEGLEKYEQFAKKHARTEENFITKYGIKEGKKRYLDWYNRSGCSGSKKLDFWKSKKGQYRRVSKESIEFFKKLLIILSTFNYDYDIVHPLVTKKEFSLPVAKGYKNFYPNCLNRNFFYDFCIPKLKIIIEYNSIYYHNDNTKEKDMIKNSYARFCGYTVLDISSIEVKRNSTECIRKCVDLIVSKTKILDDLYKTQIDVM